MKQSILSIVRWFGVATALLFADATTAFGQVTMTNNLTTVQLVTPPIYPSNPAYELQYVKNVGTGATGNTINFRQSNTMSSGYCGGWSVLLRSRTAPITNYLWFDVATLRQSGATVNFSPPPTQTGNPNTVQKYTVTFAITGLTFMNVTANLSVVVQWRLDPGSPYVSAQMSILNFQDATTSAPLSQLPFYVSTVKFPLLYVDFPVNSSHTHQLLIPFAGGLLMQDPAKSTTAYFPSKMNGPGDGSNGNEFAVAALTPPLLAYYDQNTRDCLYVCDNDLAQTFRDYEVQRRTDPSNNYVIEMRARHMPDNVYARDNYTLPYAVRIAPLVGDWVDVANTYRSYLADPNNYPTGVYKFYKDPVGASTNPMTSDFKNLVFHVHLTPIVDTDQMDEFSRDAYATRRIGLGTGEVNVWSSGFYPDFVDNMYYDFSPTSQGYNGYLPGRPSFAAAVRETQKAIGSQTGTIMAPFLSSWGGIDAPDSNLPATTESQILYANSRIGEDGTDDHGQVASGYYVVDGCNGQYQPYSSSALTTSSLWSDLFEHYLLDVVVHTDAHAIYCDAFHTGPCFSQSHSMHLPGGGNYLYVNREKEIQDVKANAGSRGATLKGAIMEGAELFYVGDVDLMHISPTINSVTDELGNFVPQAKSIPFFRMVADSVKISSFYDNATYGSDMGRRAWLNAMDVFVYGLIPHSANYAVDYFPSYGVEFFRTNAPFERYQRRMIHFLRDVTSPATWSFLKFHDGTLQRTPSFTVYNPNSSWSETLGSGTGYNDPPDAANQYLVVGLYEAPRPTGATTTDFALVVTNPWVSVNAPNLELRNCVFDPTQYGLGSYTVTRYDDAGNATSYGTQSGPYTIANTAIPPGEIWYWVFTG